MSALRVLYSRDAAFDYIVADGAWQRLDHASGGTALDVAEGDSEAVAAVIAGHIATWHRRLAFPLERDARPTSTTEMERAESEDRITEAMTYLNRLSRGAIPCSPETVELADLIWNRIDDEMVDSTAEQKAAASDCSIEVAA